MTLSPLPAPTALDAYFLEARSKLLDLAAIHDRIDRGRDSEAVADDPRVAKVHQAVAILQQPAPTRAEQIQQLFSLPYDPSWPRPTPR